MKPLSEIQIEARDSYNKRIKNGAAILINKTAFHIAFANGYRSCESSIEAEIEKRVEERIKEYKEWILNRIVEDKNNGKLGLYYSYLIDLINKK